VSAGSSIIGECSDCCTCDKGGFLVDIAKVSKSKCGFIGHDGKTYKTATLSGSAVITEYFSTDGTCSGGVDRVLTQLFSGSVTANTDCDSVSGAWLRDAGTADEDDFTAFALRYVGASATKWETDLDWYFYDFGVAAAALGSFTFTDTTYTATLSTACRDSLMPLLYDGAYSGSCTVTFSDEYTTATLIADTEAALPAFSGTFSLFELPDFLGAYCSVSVDENTCDIQAIRYKYAFALPTFAGGLCYRAAWVERFIPEAGVGLDSLEIISRGVYRPAVTATGGGGTGCLLVSVMGSTGTVASVRVLNPGSGYTSAPTINVQVAINGGTSSTGWTATVEDGRVISVSGGTAGDYLPTLSFGGGGGSGATATVTMDNQGGLASVTLTASGSAYASAPAVSITPKKSSGVTDAVIHLHLGTETEKCEVWDGITPGGYDPEDVSTWPSFPSGSYEEIPVPDDPGVTSIVYPRVFCDCSICP